MQSLSDQGQEIARAAAARHGVSVDAAAEMLRALAAGGGNQAQFSHPDLGGMGQWSRGGMLMIGDMFNNGLKARVDALANDLAAEAGRVDVMRRDGGSGFASSGWPAEFGSPSSSGGQNDMRYAFFPNARRLVLVRGGVTEVYDTGDHMISGVGQQQGGDQSITFSTGQGPIRLGDLRRVDADAPPPRTEPEPRSFQPAAEPAPSVPRQQERERTSDVQPDPPFQPTRQTGTSAVFGGGGHDVLATIEKLADLRGRGILTDEEFAAKKAELLSRL